MPKGDRRPRKAAAFGTTHTRVSRKTNNKRICAMTGTKDLKVTDNAKEAVIEKYLKRAVEERKGFIRKVKWIGRRGCPDRFVVIPGKWQGFVELKRPRGGRLSLGQVAELNELMGKDVRVAVLFTLGEVDEWLRAIGA